MLRGISRGEKNQEEKMMRKGFKRMLAILFASAFFATALAACGTVGTNSSGGNSASEAHTHTLTEVPEVAARCEKDGKAMFLHTH